MPAKRRSNFESVADILARWLGRKKRRSDLHQYTIVHRWVEVVGERLAARTQPKTLRNGVLVVTVANSAWLNELSFLRGQILQHINQMLGERAVSAIRLVAGKVVPCASPVAREPEESSSYVELPPDAVERIDREVAAIEDPMLREAIRQARVAQLARTLRLSKP
jgi:hypothetical protein